MAQSTRAASPRSHHTTSPVLSEHTSSLESGGGTSLCSSPGGLLTERCGLEVALASLFPPLESEEGSPTRGTSGPSSSDLSPGVALLSSLENKWRQRMDAYGSPEYVLKWKRWGMPYGPSILALRASARRTSDKDFTGWPTPTSAPDSEASHGQSSGRFRESVQKIVGWATPTATDHNRGNKPPRPTDTGVPLSQMAALAGWTSPRSSDGKAGRNYTPNTTGKSLAADVTLMGWNTQRATDGSNGGPNQAGGVLPFDAGRMGKTGALNPSLSRWLMGFPEEWESCAPMVTRSSRKSRPSS